jgi:hypothetical protein
MNMCSKETENGSPGKACLRIPGFRATDLPGVEGYIYSVLALRVSASAEFPALGSREHVEIEDVLGIRARSPGDVVDARRAVAFMRIISWHHDRNRKVRSDAGIAWLSRHA